VNAIHIDRLHFRGREAQRRAFMSDLDYVAWPVVTEKEYLFIRSLHVRQSASQLAAELANQALASRHLAADPWARLAADAEAVYFASHAELLACLSRDLLNGSERWYWREWAHWFERPVDEALFDCWYQHKATLPAVLAEFARKGELKIVWRKLPEKASERLLLALSPQSNVLTKTIDQGQANAVQLPEHCLSSWRDVFSDGTDWPVANRNLAALLVLWQWRPLALMHAGAQPSFQQILAALNAGSAAKTTLRRSGESRLPEQSTMPAGGAMDVATHRKQPARASASCAVAADRTIAVPPQSNAGRCPEPTVTENRAYVAAASGELFPGSIADRKGADPVIRQLEPEPQGVQLDAAGAMCRCVSSHAGVFYLVNFLNLEPVRQRLLNDEVAVAFPSAWGWLYRLAEAMDWQVDAVLGSLFTFLCGFERLEQLQHLPALPQVPELLHIGTQRYGAELFSSGLFAIDALIEVDACHVDVYFDIDAVKLEVRRSGLDIDPGWLSWLGKVLRFHYQPRAGW
jgi:hypothetical protein